jgi:uncharacterized RDD family membrane protein YckC
MTMADDYVNSVLERMPLAVTRLTQIGTELRSHIAERVAAGHPMDDVLRQLGDPAALADSYLAEVPLTPAPHGRRIAAKLVDVLIFIGLVALWMGTLFALTKLLDKPPLLVFGGATGVILLSIGYAVYVVVAEWKYGRTVGKHLFSLQVVRESGARIGLGQSFVRQLPAFFQVFWIDALFALFTDRRQRAFELLSKTRLIDATLLP